MLSSISLFICSSLMLFAFDSFVQAQQKSNLDLASGLIERCVNELQVEIDVEELKFKSNLSADYKIFENDFMNSVKKKFSSALFVNENFHFSFSISNVEVKYENVFQENIFGDFYCERKITLQGNWFSAETKTPLNNFSIVEADTISIDEIDELENKSISLTTGVKPAIPFWSSIYEPVIVIGAAATAAYLFFTVRSK